MIITDDDFKRLDEISGEVSQIEFTNDDLNAFNDLEKELSSMDLDFLLR